MREDQYETLLQSIYAMALTPDRWEEVMGGLGRAFGSHFVGNILRSHDRTKFRGVAVGIDPGQYQQFLNRWHRFNPYGIRHPIGAPGEIIRVSQIMPLAEHKRTEMFGEFLDGHELHHGLRLSIWRSRQTAQSLSIMRPWTGGDFTSDEVALAARLLAHILRAVAVMRRLASADRMLAGACSALDGVRQAVLLLDEDGGLLHANQRGEALLAQRDGLEWSDGRFLAFNRTLTARLQAVLGQAAGGNRVAPRSGALRLARPSGAPDLMLVALPLAADMDWGLPGQPASLVVIADPTLAARLRPRMLADLFGLTAAESALAAELLDHRDLADIAARSGRSLNTIRTHLARLMAKTGTHRQIDLARKLAVLPEWTETD